MCLIAFALDVRDHALLIAANRDEYYARATTPAAWWNDRPGVFGGRDGVAGGSWLAVHRNGRVAAVTNVREPSVSTAARSRGELVGDFVASDTAPLEYAESVLARAGEYAGFNLLLFDVGSSTPALYVSNREPKGVVVVKPGVHGLSNGALDAEWPKIRRLSSRLSRALDQSASTLEASLLLALADRSQPADDELPVTGVGIERERMLATAMIVAPELDYGTRASTVLSVRRDGRVAMLERSWTREGDAALHAGDRRVRFLLPAALRTALTTTRAFAAS